MQQYWLQLPGRVGSSWLTLLWKQSMVHKDELLNASSFVNSPDLQQGSLRTMSKQDTGDIHHGSFYGDKQAMLPRQTSLACFHHGVCRPLLCCTQHIMMVAMIINVMMALPFTFLAYVASKRHNLGDEQDSSSSHATIDSLLVRELFSDWPSSMVSKAVATA